MCDCEYRYCLSFDSDLEMQHKMNAWLWYFVRHSFYSFEHYVSKINDVFSRNFSLRCATYKEIISEGFISLIHVHKTDVYFCRLPQKRVIEAENGDGHLMNE
jgi:hypothetical protein